MKVLSLFAAVVLLAWTSLTYARLRTTKRGMLWLLPKLAAGAFSLETRAAADRAAAPAR